jgi:GntR family transcriptional regulator
MFDIQHDSPVPIHEQISTQIMAHVASGGLKPGARMWEYRAFAQELLTNPQVVARAYADLEWAGVLEKQDDEEGELAVTAEAAAICRARLQNMARQAIRQAVAKGLAFGLAETELLSAVQEELAAARARTVSLDDAQQAIKKTAHETRNRDSQGIQILPRQKGAGPP